MAGLNYYGRFCHILCFKIRVKQYNGILLRNIKVKIFYLIQKIYKKAKEGKKILKFNLLFPFE